MTSTANVGPVAAHEHDLLNVLFSSIPIGIAIYDHDLILQSFNSTWASYAKRFAPGEHGTTIPDSRLHTSASDIEHTLLPLFERAISGETVRAIGLRLDGRDGASYWDLILCPIYESGRVANIVQIIADATARVETYNTLERRVDERTHDLERRNEVAESLGETLALINSSQALPQVLQRLAAQARRLLGADCAAIFNLHTDEGTDKGTLSVQAFDGAPPELFAGYALPLGVGAVGEAVLKREPVLLPDTRAAFQATLDRQMSGRKQLLKRIDLVISNYRSAYALPLLVRDELYGGLALYYEQSRDLDEEDKELADMFAHQAALAIENARLRERIEQTAVAAERNRIARDLHDSVTQTLFSASLIADVLPRLEERNPHEFRRSINELRQLVRGALAEMRMLLLEMRPSTLAKIPLGDLLKQLAEATGGRSRIPVEVTIGGECGALPRPVHNALYRIAQEALNNVSKHSGACRAQVRLQCRGQGIELEVEDNGIGFDPNAVSGEHLGLDIMRERAQEIGADWKVASNQSAGCGGVGGTRVSVSWKGSQGRGMQDEY